jgi:hypothetical protein
MRSRSGTQVILIVATLCVSTSVALAQCTAEMLNKVIASKNGGMLEWLDCGGDKAVREQPSFPARARVFPLPSATVK